MQSLWKFGALFIVCVLVVGLLASWWIAREPRQLSTTVDLAHKQILANPSASSWRDTLSDLSDLASDLSGALLAAADSRFIHVRPGLRKEEIADLLGRNLDWNAGQKLAFAAALEGRYYPGTYTIPSSQGESTLREVMLRRFDKEVVKRYPTTTESVLKLDTVVKLASLIEREAGGKRDMRLISGIIWNRIFRDMPLSIDATVQYANGTSTNWWPRLKAGDTSIDSPYNTYKRKGLPPTAIANPGLSAIDAALNPIKTPCLYYLHDRHRRIHCAATYEDHLKNIRRYLQ